jgi:hypothetical protein
MDSEYRGLQTLEVALEMMMMEERLRNQAEAGVIPGFHGVQE